MLRTLVMTVSFFVWRFCFSGCLKLFFALPFKRLVAFVLPNGKTGLPRFFLRKNLAMTRRIKFRLPEMVFATPFFVTSRSEVRFLFSAPIKKGSIINRLCCLFIFQVAYFYYTFLTLCAKFVPKQVIATVSAVFLPL